MARSPVCPAAGAARIPRAGAVTRSRGPLGPSGLFELIPPLAGRLHVWVATPPARAGRARLASWWPSVGADLTAPAARARARGELIERVSAVFQGTEPRLRAPLAALGATAIPPDRLAGVSERQRRRGAPNAGPLVRVPPRFDPDDLLDWTAARSLRDGTLRYVPSMAVYFKYPLPPARRYCRADSNGLAAGRTPARATLAAVLELVERDSVALWWYNRTPRPAFRLRAAPRDRELAALSGLFGALGRDVWVLDLTSDLRVPVAAAVTRRRGQRGEELGFGFGAGLARRDAVLHALREAAQGLALRAAGGRGGAGTARFERWRRAAQAARIRQLMPAGYVRAPRHERAPPPGRALRTVIRLLARRGLDPVRVDLTRPGGGLAVVRVLVPGLCHLWPRFGLDRLYRAPVAAGWRVRRLPEGRLNQVPLLL